MDRRRRRRRPHRNQLLCSVCSVCYVRFAEVGALDMPSAREKSSGASSGSAGLRFTVVFDDAAPQDQRRLLAELKSILKRHKLGRLTISVESRPAGASTAIAEAELRGEARLVRWTQDGTLVPVSVLENHWGVQRQSIDAARRRGEIFSLFVRGRHWYPAEALKFNRSILSCQVPRAHKPALRTARAVWPAIA